MLIWLPLMPPFFTANRIIKEMNIRDAIIGCSAASCINFSSGLSDILMPGRDLGSPVALFYSIQIFFLFSIL